MKICFGMKAAPLFLTQLEDRIFKFHQLLMRPIIELHFFGQRDLLDTDNVNVCYENCKSIEKYKPVFIVHLPQEYIPGRPFDPFVDGDILFRKALDFSGRIGAKAIVIHRGCCFDLDVPYEEAETFLNRCILRWAEEAKKRSMSILIENCGFIWLSSQFSKEYVVGPLDHFYPWEIKRFKNFLKESRIENIIPVIDIAHAAISTNMLKLWYLFPEFRRDSRFLNITKHGVRENINLNVNDFIIEACPPYLHVSDSLLYQKIKSRPGDIDIYLKSEGMPIGAGNLNFNEIVRTILKNKRDVTLIMEINPLNGDHDDNQDQFDGAIRINEIFRNLMKE